MSLWMHFNRTSASAIVLYYGLLFGHRFLNNFL